MNYELQAHVYDELLRERDININKLARGVEEISELFQTICILVSQQGHQIDNIETNINNSLTHVTKANVELKKAEKYKSKKRIRCLFYILVALLF